MTMMRSIRSLASLHKQEKKETQIGLYIILKYFTLQFMSHLYICSIGTLGALKFLGLIKKIGVVGR